jgi:D-3-phosphoglycerate dehydrogenase
MPEILITENLSGRGIDELKKRFDVRIAPDLWNDRAALIEAVGGPALRALIVRNQTRVDEELLDAARGLAVIGRAGAGLDNIDVPAASARGIAVVATPDQNSISVAELAVGMMLALARHIPPADRDTRNGGWARQRFVGAELYGKTLGVVGFGRIGFLTAMRARAFGMEVLVHDTFVSPDAATIVQARADVVGLDALLQRSDFVSCHLPSTAQTKGLFGRERFACMKRSAFFINTSRGDVVDEAALTQALESGTIGGAALDVRAVEPPARSRLCDLDNVVLTPHIAAFTHEAQRRVIDAVCGDVQALLTGGRPANLMNDPAPVRRA